MSKIADKSQQSCTRSSSRRFLGRHAVNVLKACTSVTVDTTGYEFTLYYMVHSYGSVAFAIAVVSCLPISSCLPVSLTVTVGWQANQW